VIWPHIGSLAGPWRIYAATRRAHIPFGPDPFLGSDEDAQLAIGNDGTVTIVGQLPGRGGLLAVTGVAGHPLGRPQTLWTGPSRGNGTPRLAVTTRGRAIVVWEAGSGISHSAIEAATAGSAGRFGHPQRISRTSAAIQRCSGNRSSKRRRGPTGRSGRSRRRGTSGGATVRQSRRRACRACQPFPSALGSASGLHGAARLLAAATVFVTPSVVLDSLWRARKRDREERPLPQLETE